MKNHLWAICFSAALIVFTAYIALDTFVLGKSYHREAVEMNLSMFEEVSSGKEAPDADSGNDAVSSDTDAARSGDPSGETAASESESDTGADSASGSSETRSSGVSGEMSGWSWGGWGSRGSATGEMSRSGSSNDSTDSTDSSDSSDSSRSSRRSGRSGRSGGWSGGWGGDSGWSGRSSYMNDAESAEGVDAAAEYTGDTTYQDDNVTITLTEYTQYDTKIYVADVTVTSTQYIMSAFANDTYGRNITESTSAMAAAHDAVFAVNGDYYGAQERGYVIRNGIVYRSTSAGKDVMCIRADGTMTIVSDKEYTAEELVEQGVWQAFSFGPALVEDGSVVVGRNDEIGMERISNPRTAVGMIDTNHFVFVVSDGRTDESEGLSLYNLAQFMQSLGVKTAYNLDGGGSSTMYFNGQIVNNPTSWGSNIRERGVSDIVYIG